MNTQGGGPFKHAPVGFQFSYDLGDEPDEDDDEMNNTDGEEEGEEEQDDILIVEGEDQDNEEEDEIDSPTFRHEQSKGVRAESDNSPSGKVQGVEGKGFTPANKSLNVSQEEIRTQLYGGDIYLLGGSHFLMKDNENQGSDDPNIAAANKFSQASTTAGSGSEMPYKTGSFNR